MNRIMEKSNIIEVVNLKKEFVKGSEKVVIFNDLDFSVSKNEKVVITGDSGSGKSTFLNLISGLDCCDSGDIFIDNLNIAKLNEANFAKYRKKYIGLVFQFHYLLKDFNVLENVFLPAYMNGLSRKKAKSRALSLLEMVGLKERINHFPSQLSGGESQRVAVARALINDPEIILADEPTGNLDDKNSVMIKNILFDLVDELNKSLILVTHDQKLANSGDSCYMLKNGVFVKK